MAPLNLSIRVEVGGGRRFGFRLPGGGEIRGEVDDSATAPVYAVQHCVVDTYTGQIVVHPTHDEDRAQELAGILNQVREQPLARGPEP